MLNLLITACIEFDLVPGLQTDLWYYNGQPNVTDKSLKLVTGQRAREICVMRQKLRKKEQFKKKLFSVSSVVLNVNLND